MTIIPIRADEIGLASLAWWTSTTQCLANNLLTVLYCSSKYLIWGDHKRSRLVPVKLTLFLHVTSHWFLFQ